MLQASFAVLLSLLATDPYHVAIDTLPAKDHWDILSICLNIIVVAVGVFTFGVVLYQAKQTKLSTDAAKETAEAARLNADAFINSERSWIMVELEPMPGYGERIHRGWTTAATHVPVRVACRNEGRSPAWITEKRACLKIVDSIPPEPNLESIADVDPDLDAVAVGKSARAWDVTLSCEGRAGVEDHVTMLLIYGVVKYRDAFSRKHSTTFGYVLGVNDRLKRITDYPKYNENL